MVHDGCTSAWNVLCSMKKNNRPAHGVLLYGDKGVGKKYLAEEYASMLLCTADEAARPCGECKACKAVRNHTHPDVFWAAKTGKLGAISAGESDNAKEGSVRDLRSKLYEYPDIGRAKILILADCKNTGSWIQAQNMLLKTLEEPPEYGFIIFTANDKQVFINTILSRIVALPVKRCSNEQAKNILEEKGYTSEEIKEAIQIFGGNIGNCIDYITEPYEKAKVSALDNFFKNVVFSREYDALKSISIFLSDRTKASDFIESAVKIVRDAAILSSAVELPERLGCCEHQAKSLSENIPPDKILRIYKSLNTADAALKANLRAEFVLTALCAEIFE